MRRPRWGTLVAIILACVASSIGWSQKSRVFEVATDPPVRYWWGGVPEAVRAGALKTGDFSNIEPSDFLGPGACQGCHRDNYERWSEHRHRFMNAPAKPSTVKGDFGSMPPKTIDYFGGRATFTKDSQGYLMQLAKRELERTYRVTQTIGSRFFQYYVGVQIDGPEAAEDPLYHSEHVLPFGYWLDYEQWVPVVHVEKTREGEPSVVDSMRRDPFRDPAVHDYAQSCSQCHTTLPTGDWLIHRQPSFPMTPRGFSFDLESYVADNHPGLISDPPAAMSPEAVQSALLAITRKKAPVLDEASGISCETCHYGGRAHVESGGAVLPRMFPTSPRLFTDGRDPAVELARNPTNQNWTCGRCHQGTRFEFAAGMGTWNSTEHSDAMKGDCYLSADPGRRTLRCVDCHSPHQTTGKAWSRSPDEDDRLCLQCHGELEPATAREAHTRHPMGSPGARCMNCHMPRVNEGLQDMVRTHMIFSPTNRAMLEANQPNACNMCHVDQSLEWTLTKLRAWYAADELPDAFSDRPATIEWLTSWHPTTQMVAADVLTKAKAEWAIPELVETLDSRYMLVRQFAQIGLERMLEPPPSELGYRFYMFADERRAPLDAVRSHHAPDRDPVMKDPVTEDVDHYRQLVAFKPSSPSAHYYLGNALVAQGTLDQAVEHYRRAIALDGSFARAHNNLGVALKEQGLLAEASDQHLKALSLEPTLIDAHVALGNVRLVEQRPTAAAEQFELALAIDPAHPQARYNLGLLHHSEGRLGLAVASYRRAAEASPNYGEALNNLGIALAALGSSEEAIEAFERALSSTSTSVFPSAHNNLGWVLELEGRGDEALEHFEVALQLEPGSVSARIGLAEVLLSRESVTAGDRARAILLSEQAATATGESSAQVLDTLSRAYAAAGDYSQAMETVDKALGLSIPDELAAMLTSRRAEYRRLQR